MIRRVARVVVGLLGVAAVVGCGGSTADETDQTSNDGSGGAAGHQAGAAGVGGGHEAGTGGVAGGAGTGGSHDIVGSYDLTFGAVTQDKKPLGQDSSSPGTGARLDLRAAGSGYEAVVTPRFGAPAPMTVQVTATTVVLDGSTIVSGESFGSAIDTWKTFTLGRNPSGGLDGSASLVGDETAYAGDVLESTHVTGVATLGPDVTAPSLRVVPPSSLDAPGSMLPWETIAVNLSEGVLDQPAQPVATAVEIRVDGQALPASADLSPGSAEPGGWAGATRLGLRLNSWDVAGADVYGTSTLSVTRAGEMRDPTGNLADGLVAPVKVLGVPGAQSSHGFDTDVVTTQFWGHTALLGGGLTGQHDPLCESGGCVAFGPMDMGYCAKETAGIAARAKVTGAATSVSVRFRVMAAGAQPSLPPLQVKLVSHDGKSAYGSSMVTLTATGEDAALPYASPWSTLVVPLPAGASDEVGVEVSAGTNAACGFTPPAIATRVLVESIATN